MIWIWNTYLENNLDINWISMAVENIDESYDTIIMNPPFGSQRPGADAIFLEKALELASNIWTIHMSETKDFIQKLVKANSGEIISAYEFDFLLNKTMPFHTRDKKTKKAILYHIASLR